MEITNNIRHIWTDTIRTSPGVIIFSPYISEFLLEVIGDHAKNIKAVYTRFIMKEFHENSSSIATLLKLSEKGIALYAINDLHAKILLSDKLATIGSQNATNNSENLFELTSILNTPRTIEKVKFNVGIKIKNAIELHSTVLLNAAKYLGIIGPCITDDKTFDEFFLALEDQTNELLNFDHEFEDIERLNSDHKNRLLQELDTNIDALANPDIQRVTIKKALLVETTSTKGTYPILTLSNLHHPNRESSIDNLLTKFHWDNPQITSNSVQLNTHERYLVLDKKSQRLGWAKVSDTRIHFVSSGVVGGLYLKHYGVTFAVSLRANAENTEHYDGANLEIELANSTTNLSMMLICYFNGADLQLKAGPFMARNTFPHGFFNKQSMDELFMKILKLATTPFNYGLVNTGRNIVDFFPALDDYYTQNYTAYGKRIFGIELWQVHGNHILALDYETYSPYI